MILEVILKTLNPHSPAIRKVYLDQAGEILQILVLKLPMVAFSQTKQKIAVGTTDSTIMIYDLKTAAFWKCLEGHEGPISAIVFNKTGDILASYSAQDLSVRLWKIEIGFFQGLVGFKTIKPYNSIPLSDVKRTAFNYKEFIDCISFQWKDENFKLTREDARSYTFHI
jgi:WD40 repeat protein